MNFCLIILIHNYYRIIHGTVQKFVVSKIFFKDTNIYLKIYINGGG